MWVNPDDLEACCLSFKLLIHRDVQRFLALGKSSSGTEPAWLGAPRAVCRADLLWDHAWASSGRWQSLWSTFLPRVLPIFDYISLNGVMKRQDIPNELMLTH